MQSKADLLEVVLTLAPTSGFTGLLHSRQQESNQDRDDRDHNKQFDQRERTSYAITKLKGHLNLPRTKKTEQPTEVCSVNADGRGKQSSAQYHPVNQRSGGHFAYAIDPCQLSSKLKT